jgi:hypothetical protein
MLPILRSPQSLLTLLTLQGGGFGGAAATAGGFGAASTGELLPPFYLLFSFIST